MENQYELPQMRSQASLLLPWLPGKERRQGQIQSQDQGEPPERAPAQVSEVQAIPLPSVLDLDRKMPLRVSEAEVAPLFAWLLLFPLLLPFQNRLFYFHWPVPRDFALASFNELNRDFFHPIESFESVLADSGF